MFNLKTKLFFLPIEIKTRELYPKLYFAKKALDKNFSIFIGDKAGIFRATKYFNSGVYFYKSINFTDTGHIKKIKKGNNKYIVLDEEGGFSFSNDSEYSKFLTYRSSKENLELIDRFFNWGNFDYQNCLRRYSKFKKKFKISGGLRFEICQKKIFDKIYKFQNNDLRKRYKTKYILLTTSHITSKKEIKNYTNSDSTFMKIKTKSQKTNRYKELSSLLKLNLEFKKLILNLAKNFPNIPIVIRPHPSENLNDWKRFVIQKLPSKKNIFINSDDDINVVINNSICLINSKSSSSLHAFFQKKPIISFIPKNVKYRKRIFDYVGSAAQNTKEVANLIRLILEKKKTIQIKNKGKKLLSHNVCNYVNKVNSSDIILDEVKKIYKSKTDINKFLILFLSPFYKMTDFIFKLFKIRYHNQNLSKSAIRLRKEKLSGEINKNEILNFFDNFGLIKKVKIISFGKNCFFIYKNN